VEHLTDWRHFLLFVKKTLKKNGSCLILCPNYKFPYESHFGIPVIINKKITYFLYKNRIQEKEIRENCVGLWKSLNFIKYHQVEREIKKLGLKVTTDNNIIIEMLNRLKEDKEFYIRHKSLYYIAIFFMKLKIFTLLKLKFFQKYSPYMKLEIKKN